MDFHRRRKIDANIDMTPMIDTILQLFLIFLLSASFVASSVRLNLPQAAANQHGSGEPIVVSIDAANQVYINNESIVAADLPRRLPAMMQKSGMHEVIVRADQSLQYK